ncbi:hypothetical protein [Ruegeria atlantica]|nr:hypothetical protein [Ruegeria atlantica]
MLAQDYHDGILSHREFLTRTTGLAVYAASILFSPFYASIIQPA